MTTTHRQYNVFVIQMMLKRLSEKIVTEHCFEKDKQKLPFFSWLFSMAGFDYKIAYVFVPIYTDESTI